MSVQLAMFCCFCCFCCGFASGFARTPNCFSGIPQLYVRGHAIVLEGYATAVCFGGVHNKLS